MIRSIMANRKIVLLSLFIILGMVSSDFQHTSVIDFRFTKTKDGSNEYEFEFDLSDGAIYRAKTFKLNERLNIYVMIGKEQIYYTELTDDQLKHEKTFSNSEVRIAHQVNGGLELMDNDNIYRIPLTNSSGDYISVSAYQSAWDIHNICFENAKTANQTFLFKVLSSNNLKEYYGETYRQTDDVHLQSLDIMDGTVEISLEIQFTEEEVQSNKIFCRDISKVVSLTADFGKRTDVINPKLKEALSQIIPQDHWVDGKVKFKPKTL